MDVKIPKGKLGRGVTLSIALCFVVVNILCIGPLSFVRHITGSYFASASEHEDLNIISDTIFDVGGTVGNLYVKSGTLDLNGQELYVTGNVYVSGGAALNMNGGQLSADGEFNLAYQGDGCLKMTDCDDVLSVASDFHVYSGDKLQLTDGTIYIGGDLNKLSRSDDLFPSGNHTVVFNGTKMQTVSYGGFNNLTIDSVGVNFLYDSYVRGILTTTYGQILNGSKLFAGGPNFKFVGAWNGDITIGEDTTLSADTQINGNLYVNTNSMLDIGGKQLSVNGDFYLADRFGSFGGNIKMTNADDVLRVGGNFTIYCWENSNQLTDGTIYIGGNFKDERYYPTFTPSGNHTVVFNGIKMQTVSFNCTECYFNNLTINSESVNFQNGIYDGSPVVHGTVTTVSGQIVNGSNLRASGPNVRFEGAWNGDITIDEYTELNSDTEIDGNLYVTSGLLNLKGNLLYVTGNVYVQNFAYLDIGGGQLYIDGNFNLSDSYGNSGGFLKMTTPSDEVHIKGNFTVNSISLGTPLTEGEIYIGGNFKQIGSSYDFKPSGNHTVIFNGTGQQTVSFENSGSYFNIVKSTNRNLVITGWNGTVEYLDDTTVPTVPNTTKFLKITSYTDNEVVLSWFSSADYAAEVVQYEIFLNDSLFDVTTETSYTATNLPQDDNIFKVRAVDSEGNKSDFSNTVFFDNIPPSTPSGLTFNAVTVSTVSLLWESSTDNTNVRGYEVFRDGVKTATVTSTNYTDKDLSPAKTYQYYVVAFDDIKNYSGSSKAVTIETPEDNDAPTAPSNLWISSRTSNSVKLTWYQSSDNVSVVGYYVYRDGQYYATVTTNEFEETVEETGNFVYSVKAFDNNGNVSGTSNTVSYDNEKPTKPIIETFSTSEHSVYLAWNASDNVGIRCYRINVTWLDNGKQKSRQDYVYNANSYTDNDVSYLGDYTYTVVAFDESNNSSEASEPQTVTVNADTTPPVVVSIAPNQKYLSKTVPLSVKVTDNYSVKSAVVEYSYDKTTWMTAHIFEDKLNGKQTEYMSYNWNVSNLEDGVIYLRATATDYYNNQSSVANSPMTAIYILNTPPEMPRNISTVTTDDSIELLFEQLSDTSMFDHFDIYRSEDGETFTRITTNYKYINYLDSTAELGISYQYKIKIVDVAGNESEFSNIVTISLPADTTAPKINSITVFSATTTPSINVNQQIGVSLSDNFRLADITVTLVGENETNYGIVYQANLGVNAKVVYFNIPTDGLTNGNYTLTITLKDTSGNITEKSYGFIYTESTLSVPTLIVMPQGYRNELSWTINSNETIDGFRIYRKDRASGEFKVIARVASDFRAYNDLNLNPAQEYFYKIEAVDLYQHTSASLTVSGIPTFDDDINPRAFIGYSRAAIATKSTTFDASGSQDNHRVAYYYCDFGDGTNSGIQTSSKITHTYTQKGDYTLVLTVFDDAGNSGSTAINVHVYPSNYTEAVFTLRDSVSKSALREAIVYVSEEEVYITNNSGQVTIVAPKQSAELYFYKSGYLPVHKTYLITDDYSATIELVQDEIITGKMDIRELDLEEIKNLGIDTTAPENQNVYSYDLEVEITKDKGVTEVKFVVNQDGQIIPTNAAFTATKNKDDFTLRDTSEEKFNDIDNTIRLTGDTYETVVTIINGKNYTPDSTGNGSGNGNGNGNGSKNGKGYEGPPIVAFFKVSRDISWLKEFYEISLSVTNNATTEFEIADTLAVLDVPSGLSLVNTNANSAASQTMGVIKGGQTSKVSWTLRGDVKGDYYPTARFTGILDPFGVEVSATFKPETALTVKGSNAMQMTSIDTVIRGEKEYIWEFKLENVSDKPIYNLTVKDVFSKVNSLGLWETDTAEYKIMITPDGTKLYIDKEGNVQVVLPALGEEVDLNNLSFKTSGFTMNPGETLIGRYVYDYSKVPQKLLDLDTVAEGGSN